MRNPDPANWGKWSLIPNPELWQAVCLSMDFEPPQRCNFVEFLRLEQNTFNDRMQVCMANIAPQPRPEAARVNLAIFAAVVSKWGWPIPQQLQAIAQHAPTPATTAITAPVVADSASDKSGSRKLWTPEKLTELAAYRVKHTMAETATKFSISEQRIRKLLPSASPKASFFPSSIHRVR